MGRWAPADVAVRHALHEFMVCALATLVAPRWAEAAGTPGGSEVKNVEAKMVELRAS